MALVGENQWTQDELIELLSSFQLSLFAFTGQNRIGVFEGINELGGSIVVCTESRRVVVVDGDNGCLLQVGGADLSSIKHNEILDLSDEGNRWEGDVLNDEPFGWGIAYDKEGRKEYEGFRVRGVNMGYGCQYYADIGRVEYDGEWCDGRRWGRGLQYDRKGGVVYEGEWMNNDPVEKSVEIASELGWLHNRIEELSVRGGCCSGDEWTVLDWSWIPSLRELRVGNWCFVNVREWRMVGLSKLESVVIGENSFTRGTDKDPNRRFVLKKCPSLKELKVGRYSFSDYSVCEIEETPALEVIEMGEVRKDSYNFYHASLELARVFLLKESRLDMPGLKSLRFGEAAFCYCSRVVFDSDCKSCE